MSHEVLKIGDIVEIIEGNVWKPMPGDLGVGSRGTVIDSPEASFVKVDYGLEKPVWSLRTAIRKVQPPPPQREATSNWDDLIVWRPKEIAHV